MITGRGAAGTQRDGDTADRVDDRVGGAGVAARFGRDAADDASPPVFGTAPWGYRRAEVDAWASWVARLVEQGRRETVRADSAEATLQATLQRLDELERRHDPAPASPIPPSPEAASPEAAFPEVAGTGSPDTGSNAPGTSGNGAPAALPRRRPGAAGAPAAPGGEEGQRLRVVETTLGEVMALLQRLAP
ncbi:hypothetical protein [Pseudonocardia sp. McavD-2-B]|uniref:hypothetical protein n=1 Tax=Pseudonocardia sp. McavD-2-B TaxID=2954499 RepID=UPI00209852DF|nr:hypothetical protein [Pseudonocardia sp. McavD-2-B]MCO7191747.1 hypothetical protein [Pseudonocardia sp. McavD-2-B]